MDTLMKSSVTGCLSVFFLIAGILFCMQFSSCGLFDKELKQDQHLEKFRQQLSRVEDSLYIPVKRIKAFMAIIEEINTDKDLITLRKKNMLLIDANNYISNEYMRIKNYTKALDYSNLSIALDSSGAKGYFNRGGIYQAMDKDSLALLDYTRAIKINGNYADAYYNRGIINEKWKKYKESLDDYNKAIKQQPSYQADVYNNRGNVNLALKDSAKALDDYSKVLKLDTANIYAYSNRVGLYFKQKEFNKALEDCNKALSIDSTFVRIYSQRAGIYEQKKDYEEAIDDYKKVLELDPHDYYKAREAIRRLRPLVKRR
jgi:tetratricopeptide (TPR) repeat protein